MGARELSKRLLLSYSIVIRKSMFKLMAIARSEVAREIGSS